jgi:ABC-2 type transport system ATP-binding protein
VDVEDGADVLVAALAGRGLRAREEGRHVLVVLDPSAGTATYDALRDTIAELGLPLVRLEQRRHSLEEIFRDELATGSTATEPREGAA